MAVPPIVLIVILGICLCGAIILPLFSCSAAELEQIFKEILAAFGF